MQLRGGRDHDDVMDDRDAGGGGERWFAHVSKPSSDTVGSAGAQTDSVSETESEVQSGYFLKKVEQASRPGGGVLAWGVGIHGRLGSGDWVDRFEPCRALEELKGQIVQVPSTFMWHYPSNPAFGLIQECKSRCRLGITIPWHSVATDLW